MRISFKVLLMAFVLIFDITHFVWGAKYVHLEYDWEGDNSNEQSPPPSFESCFSCHISKHEGATKTCEDCHVSNSTGPYKVKGDFVLREDFVAPKVYEHYYFAEELKVKNQSLGTTSTCFGYDPVIGGKCHGVPYAFRDSAGKYFAFNENYTGEEYRIRDPYEYAGPVAILPDTANCLFCHYQEDDNIRASWGDAKQIDSKHSSLKNDECYGCHVEGGVKPVSFHAKILSPGVRGIVWATGSGGEGRSLKSVIIIIILLLISALYLSRKKN